MCPCPPALFCLGLCLVQAIEAQIGSLPKPSLQALPSSLVPLDKSVNIRCQGPPDVHLYRLEKLGTGKYEDQDSLFIPMMKSHHAGRYRCSYQNGSIWSPPSDQLELVATGVFSKPSLSAHPSSAVSPGRDVTLQCQTKFGFDQFALHKEGDTGHYKSPEKWYRADFPIITVTAAHSGTYRCYSFSSGSPYLWSAPSNPLVLVVTEASASPSQVHSEVPSSKTELPEASRRPTVSSTHKVSTTEMSRNVTVFPEESSPPFGFAHHHYAKGNLIRICLGAMILLFLAGLLAEDWYSRKKPLPHRMRAVQRPLPPLPLTQKSHDFPDGGRPDVRNHGPYP